MLRLGNQTRNGKQKIIRRFSFEVCKYINQVVGKNAVSKVQQKIPECLKFPNAQVTQGTVSGELHQLCY